MAVFAALLIVFLLLIRRFTGRITRPLINLTRAAEQVDAGRYDYQLDYDGDDEVGILTRTFKRLMAHLEVTISDLSDLAYVDSLTSVPNKGAFDQCVSNIQEQVNNAGRMPEFAVCVFDCNDLKQVNDQNGHDKGDIYLKEAAAVICEVFANSSVFRIGGDEFAAVLLRQDYENREELLRAFHETCAGRRKSSGASWEKVDVARGMAVFDPSEDQSVSDVVRRADRLMYEDKWRRKAARAGSRVTP